MEKLLLEACLEIFAEDLLVGIQDMGAAGLTSSSVEMAGRSGSGLDLDLDAVPRRAKRLTPYEMLLSESQERMLLVTQPGKEDRVFAICKKWELDVAIIGRVTDTGHWTIRATPGYDPLADAPIDRETPVVVCDLPVDFLTDAAPKYDRPQKDDPSLPARLAFDPARSRRLPRGPRPSSPWSARPTSARGAGCGGSTITSSAAARTCGRAATPPWCACPASATAWSSDKLLAFASDCNGRLCELDPFQGAAMAVAEACRNLVCVGAEPIGLTDCLNFGSPERPEIMRQFARAIDGMAAACTALGVPIVSGNVSLYNETDGRAILPTPTIGAVGLVRDLGDVVRSIFPAEGLNGAPARAALRRAARGLGVRGLAHGGGEGPASADQPPRRAQPPTLMLELLARAPAPDRERARCLRGRPRHDAGRVRGVGGDDEAAMIGATIMLARRRAARAGPLRRGAEPDRGDARSTEHLGAIERLSRARKVPVHVLGLTGGDVPLARAPRRGARRRARALHPARGSRALPRASIVGRVKRMIRHA
jgi:selenophosphate synthetase-related protein